VREDFVKLVLLIVMNVNLTQNTVRHAIMGILEGATNVIIPVYMMSIMIVLTKNVNSA